MPVAQPGTVASRWPVGAKIADTESGEMQDRAKEISMRKVVVSEFLSVDGVMEDPGGAEQFEHGGWVFQFDRGPEGDKFKLDEIFASDALLLGRVTYEGFAAAWPSRTDEVGFADKMNSMPKYVVSTTLEEPLEWNNSTVVDGDVAEAVAELKREVDGDILVNGSAQLVQTLMEHDLVDEYRLMVFLIILGAGKRLFGETSDAVALRLMDAKPAGETLILIYEPGAKDAGNA
jgi:dihydrofolate reductase